MVANILYKDYTFSHQNELPNEEKHCWIGLCADFLVILHLRRNLFSSKLAAQWIHITPSGVDTN